MATKKERIISARDADDKDLQERLQKLEFCHSIFKQEDNSLREENKSLRTAIRLINNNFQNEDKCSQSTFSQNLHDQISDGVNDVSPRHNEEASSGSTGSTGFRVYAPCNFTAATQVR